METLSGEPKHPGFHRGRLDDQLLFELLGDYDLGGGLSPDWRKRVEIDDYEIGWPELYERSREPLTSDRIAVREPAAM